MTLRVARMTSLNFEPHLHQLLLERLEHKNNTRALEFITTFTDVSVIGVVCGACNESNPFYNYPQDTRSRHGILFSKCIDCRTAAKCPWSVMSSHMKNNSVRRKHAAPEFNVDGLKELYYKQKGRCAISGAYMKIKRGDGDPYNMSPERVDNSKGYVKGNVVLICQFLQISKGNYSPVEIRKWFQYDMTTDGFIFDSKVFTKSNERKERREYRKSIKFYDESGGLVSKTCTDCEVRKLVSLFSKNKSICKKCAVENIRKRLHNNPRLFVEKMTASAKNHSRVRSKKRRRNDSSSCIDDNLFNMFIAILILQGGRCAITGVPFVYQTNHCHAPSPDRIDNSKGYVIGNIEFIIIPLNTPRKPPNAELRKLIQTSVVSSIKLSES